MPPSPLRVLADRFIDAEGRDVLLRGVNLGGDSKTPWPDGGTDHPSDFADHRVVSFVGRPFPLGEAEEHFSRLRAWGFNCVRLLTTWEAVEHAGPGVYDAAYLDYFAEIARLAGDFGLYVVVDFHQDAWSRMSGGSGAPGWTFEAVGLDFTRFHAANAALVMQHAFDHADPNPHQAGYPRMSWSSNYRLPANGLMWSLFFGGRWLTPRFEIDGRNVQDFLQGRYLACLDQVAQRLAGLAHVVGFESLNEPSIGWLGQGLSDRGLDNPSPLAIGPAISPLDGLALARGAATTVPVFGGREEGAPRVVAERTLNPAGVAIWADDAGCPFEAAGIYAFRDGAACALDEEAFRRGPSGAGLDVPRDVFAPFFEVVAGAMRAHRPDWLLFAEIEVAGPFVGRPYPRTMPPASVNAPHWYDLANLATKRFDVDDHVDAFTGRPLRGEAAVRRSYVESLGARKALAEPFGGPTLIGEIGVQFELDDGASYAAWAAGARGPQVFAKQALALHLMSDALDALGLSATWWNYSASNRNDPRIGDGWNQEDLSIFSRDQQDGAHDGGRAVEGFARPYVRAAQGRLLRQGFDRATRAFEAVIEADPRLAAPTEIATPAVAYPAGVEVAAPAGCRWEAAPGVVRVFAVQAGPMTVSLTPRRAPAALDAPLTARATPA
ncbi:MAG: hypothetical protein JWP49_2609 [Phenylobacterium sp.]|nr:hypothetical protein [Phenylobacterium sp.]